MRSISAQHPLLAPAFGMAVVLIGLAATRVPGRSTSMLVLALAAGAALAFALVVLAGRERVAAARRAAVALVALLGGLASLWMYLARPPAVSVVPSLVPQRSGPMPAPEVTAKLAEAIDVAPLAHWASLSPSVSTHAFNVDVRYASLDIADSNPGTMARFRIAGEPSPRTSDAWSVLQAMPSTWSRRICQLPFEREEDWSANRLVLPPVQFDGPQRLDPCREKLKGPGEP